MDPKLAGLANNTKWNELQQLMSGLGQRAPYWRTKSINGFVYPPQGWDGDWTYHFRLGEHKFIEWCEMQPRLSEGALTMNEAIDMCRRIGFEIEALDRLSKSSVTVGSNNWFKSFASLTAGPAKAGPLTRR